MRSEPRAREPQRPRRADGLLRAVLLGLTALATQGCLTATSPIPQPAVAVPTTWQGPRSQEARSQEEGDTQALPELATWWSQLGDATLSDLIAEALSASPDLRLARARLEQARARRLLAGSELLPSVTASMSRSSSKVSGGSAGSGTTGRYNNQYDAGLDLSWEPDISGGTRSAVRASQADLGAAEADLHDTQVSLAAEVALTYVELRSLQSRLAIARDNLERQSETWQLTSWRAQAGLTSELDVEQARTNLEQTRAQIPALQTGSTEAEHRLETLLGRPPGELHETLAASGPIPKVPEEIIAGIPAETLRQRPDVRSAELRLVAETARLDQAEAARYPSLGLSGSLSLESSDLDQLLRADTVVRSVLGRLTAPIFDRRRILREIEIQSASQEQALVALETTILNALSEVEGSLVALDGARQRQAALSAASASAQVSAELARQQYTAGLVSYQRVLDTERSLLSVDDSLRTSEAELASELIRLYRALGGGWVSEPVCALSEPEVS